jgi:bifunctional non-homologous end joining protein LigD
MTTKKKRAPSAKTPASKGRRAKPVFVTPMAAQVVKRLPEGDDWTYELKFDGYRALIIKDKRRVELRSRKNKDLTGMYRGITAAGSRLNADEAVVALDAQGSPSFQALQHRGSHPGHQIVFYAFDLLHLDGKNLTGEPLLKRRARLARVLDGSGLLPSQELPGAVPAIVEAVRGLGLEG